MSTLKISKHSDVPAALDLVKEEVEKESKRIREAGSVALNAGVLKPAKEAIAYAEKLGEFVKKIQKLGDEWVKLESQIDAAAPEVREIVNYQPQKSHKTGYTRNVESIAPKSNFTVRFPDGVVISDKKAFIVFAKTIEKIGADQVSLLGIMCGGEPIVTKDRSLYKKDPSAVASISGGWFVKTHSSTSAKVAYVKRIADALGVKLVVTVIPGDGSVMRKVFNGVYS